MNLPTIITVARIVLVPVFALVYLWPESWTYWAAAGLFALAAVTDWLDGYLARKLGQSTRFGAFLDPVADKIIVVTALVLLVGQHGNLWLTVPCVVIILRELVISALREWMAEMNRRGLVEVSWVGKIKTIVQMAAVTVLLAQPPTPQTDWVLVGYGLLYLAAVMTLWSMVAYIQAAWPTFRAGMQDEESPDVALRSEDG
jgi:CDP-diacylglycerol--glycerol-3-phosphate 3-phosphatidyltransferase